MRLTVEQVEQSIERQNNGNNDYRKCKNFSLADDGDGAHVRFLFENAADAYFFRTHSVTLSTASSKQFNVDVDCIAGNGVTCPLCKEALKYKGVFPRPVDIAKDSMYMPMLVIDKKSSGNIEVLNELQVWKRGVKFYKTDLNPHASRNGNLYENVTELSRVGRKGEQTTQYRSYSSKSDFNGNPFQGVKPLQEMKADLGFTNDLLFGADDSLIKSWTADQMEEALTTGRFPKVNNMKEVQEAPQPRNRVASVNYGF